jgi:DNA polymerase-3 subunit alpha
MTLDMGNTDKLNEFRQDAMRLGIEVVPPSVRSSGKRVFESLIAAGALRLFRPRPCGDDGGRGAHDGGGQFCPRERLPATRSTFSARAAAAAAEPSACPRPKYGCRPSGCNANSQAVGFYLSAHPLDEYRQTLDKMRVQNWADFSAAVKRGATAGPSRRHGHIRQERKTRTGNKMCVAQLSDMTGQYEVVLFSETLAAYRDLLVEGKSLIIEVAAENRPEGVNLRVNRAQSLDAEASKHQKALRIFVRDDKPATLIQSHLRERGEGQVSLVVIKPDGQGEVEIGLKDRFMLGPKLAAALKSVPGIVDVELV